MSSITVRDLPPELHDALRKSAEDNRRSLNAEVLSRLESTFAPLRRISKDELLEKLARVHDRLRRSGFIPPTDEEIHEAINQGRR